MCTITKCITKIDGITIADGEDLDLVMPMYNLIKYSSNYSETTGSLWFYTKHEATNFNAGIANDNNFKCFKYKSKLLGSTVTGPTPNNANRIQKNTGIAVPLKNLSDFWRSIEMPLINREVELKPKQTKYCVLSTTGNNDTDIYPNNIIITIKKHKIICPCLSLYQQKTTKNYQNVLAKDLKDQFSGMNKKEKVR